MNQATTAAPPATGEATGDSARAPEAARASPMMAQYLGDQGRLSRLPAVLSDGRLLRTVLRRRGDRQPRARHRADQARQARGRGHPDVRRADRARRRLSASPDRARAIASRSASSSKTRPKRRSAAASRWCGATSSAWSRRERSPRSGCSSPAAPICCWRCSAAGPARAASSSASPRSTSRPAPSASAKTDEAGLGPEIARDRAERDRRAAGACSTIPPSRG